MVINVHAGHNPDGKIACGAVGLIKESTEARAVKDKVIAKLRANGHVVHDCTCNNGKSQNDVLVKILKLCNTYKADLDISIHFNSGAADKTGNGKTTGVEVLIYSVTSKAYAYAKKVTEAVAALGFKNRGVKVNRTLYFLRTSKNPSMLIECCFVDDKDDVALYNADKMADAIVKAIVGQSTDYSAVFNASYYSNKYPDLKAAFGTDAAKLLNHFLNHGMLEGRQASAEFNVQAYKARYADLMATFGRDLRQYYLHYINFGKKEGRTGI